MLRITSLLLVTLACGCGVHIYRPSVVVDPYDSREITDRDIQKAFRSRPQLRLPATVAIFETGSPDKALPRRVQSLKGITKVYQIPTILVDGPRHGDGYQRRRRAAARPKTVSLKKLRLLAARGRADLLVLSSATIRREVVPNWTICFAPLLVTGLFLPMNHVKMGYQQEVLVIDVRNGYLYRHFKIRQQASERYVQSLALGRVQKRLIRTLRERVRRQTLRQLRATLVPGRSRLAARSATASRPSR